MNKDTINSIDKDDMFNVIADLYKHIEHSFDIIKTSNINCNFNIHNILICGMGGSAIGGDFVKTVLGEKVNLTISVNRQYSIPKWVNQNTLVIICSYSGNTEETISSLIETEKLGVKPVIISSGGKLLETAINKNYSYIKMPKGIQPRAAFGYSASLLLLLLNKIGVVDKSIIDDLYLAIDEIRKMSIIFSEFSNDNEAMILSSKIFNSYPIIYGTKNTDVVSLRFRCQLAENTKILSSHYIIPEQNHNEIEGFLKNSIDNCILIWIYDKDDDDRNIKRIKVTSKILQKSCEDQYFYKENGGALINRLLKLIYFFDWVSFYGSIYNNINPTPVNKILELKKLMK